jgi:large subunit ribosomal protein L4
MLTVPVYNESGAKIGEESIDEALLGGEVNPLLLKQAIVRHHANQRQGTVATKTRAQVQGSSRKLYKQKGTGRARRGNIRTPIMKGGGHAFAKKTRDFRQDMPRKMRRLARNNAVLAKIRGDEVKIVDGVTFDQPKTSRFAKLLEAMSIGSGCVFATAGIDANAYKSGRNIPRVEIMDVAELNAYAVLRRRSLIFTRDAFAKFREIAATRPERGGNDGAEA